MLSNKREEKYPFTYKGINYAKDVVSGKINVSKLTILSCKRFLNDMSREFMDDDCPFKFDFEKSEKFLRQAQKFNHVKGNNWKTNNLEFEPWQCFIFAAIMGFMRITTGRRRFRNAFIEVPRGCGKSAIASILGLYFLALDGELGAEVLCASTKKDAARIVFDSSRAMAKANPKFLKYTKTTVQQHQIKHDPTGGIMKPLSSDSKSQDGLNPNLIIGDEVHEWNHSLYGVLDSAMTKRDDSLFFMITTAGFNTDGIGFENHSYSVKILNGEVEDDTWFTAIYTIDEGDDWEKEETWKKANPNYGISVDPINFSAKAKKAKETPFNKTNFLVKHLNQWQNQASPFFSLTEWDACADTELRIEQFFREKCMAGLDLAQKCDLVSEIYLFKRDGIYYAFDKSYIPEAKLADERNINLAKWKSEGWLHTHEGEVIDFEKIQDDVIDMCKVQHDCIDVLYDPWSANETGQRLMKENISAKEFRMTTQNLSEPMKKLDALLKSRKFKHNGSPLFRWAIGNVVAKPDANENVFPRKSHERLKIDPVVALLMALGGWIADGEEGCIYEERGIRVI
jgi:phage terminase large subunit-like protein